MIRVETLTRAVVAALFTFWFGMGATFNGVFIAEVHALILPLVAMIVAGWLFIHWRAKWTWYRTPLELPFVLWYAAIFFSLVTNLTDWRRILIGLWYVTLYVGVWYIFSDILANSGLKRAAIRAALIDSALISGAVVVGFGFWQLANTGRIGGGILGFPRPVSTFGNPNSLAAFLVVIVSFAFGRLLAVKELFPRLLAGGIFLLSALLLLLTSSRGGWIGGAAGLATVVALWLIERDLFSPRKLRAWFNERTAAVKALLAVLLTALFIGGVGVAVYIFTTLDDPGRNTDLRTFIWDSALTMFAEKPLTGHGLFTFGKGLVRLNSMPPTTPHSHAHSIPLQVAAELGVVGLAALIFTIIVALRTLRQSWQQARDRRAERAAITASAAGMVAFGVHHLFDLPAMMPAIAILGILTLALTLTPVEPVPLQAQWRRYGHPVAMLVLWGALLATGWWSAGIYQRYVEIIRVGLEAGDYLGAARDLQTIIDADPGMPLYYWQQGYFYGAVASITEDTAEREAAAQAGVAAFDQALQTDPQSADAWANRGGLLRQLGQDAEALNALRTAAESAPKSWPLWLTYARHAELLGEDEQARAGYLRLIEAVGIDAQGVYLHPALIHSPIFQTFDPPAFTGLAQVVAIWKQQDDPQGALATWDENAPWTFQTEIAAWIIRALIAHDLNDDAQAQEWLVRADAVDDQSYEGLWVFYAKTILGGEDPEELADQMAVRLLEADYLNGVNLWRNTFLRDVTSRIFLPQVGYESLDPLLVYLVGESPNIR